MWNKREGLFNPGTWASHGIIPGKCLGSCVEASAQSEKTATGRTRGWGLLSTNPSPADEDASLFGGKSGSLEGTLCSQPPDSGEQRHVCGGAQGGGRGLFLFQERNKGSEA